MNAPAVSVIIPTRNSPETVRRALRSIQSQDFADYEVLVVDDGSNQGVRDAYASWWHEFDSRYRLELPALADMPGQRQSATRNRGIRMARGKYLAFLDHDDEWCVQDYLSGGVEALELKSGDYYFADMRGIRADKILIQKFLFQASGLCSGKVVTITPKSHEVSHRDMASVLRHHCVHVNTMIIRREIALRMNGFVERLHYCEDIDFMFRAVDASDVILHRPDVVANYTLPDAGCLTLAQTQLERWLQGVYACTHARAVCQRRIVRKAARAQESWYLRRELAMQMLQQGFRLRAIGFAWQGLAVFPSLGGMYDLLKYCVCPLPSPKHTAPNQ